MNLNDLFLKKKENLTDFMEDEIKEIEKVLIKLKKYCESKPECEDCIFSDDPNEACFLVVPSYWRIEGDSSTETETAETENN